LAARAAGRRVNYESVIVFLAARNNRADPTSRTCSSANNHAVAVLHSNRNATRSARRGVEGDFRRRRRFEVAGGRTDNRGAAGWTSADVGATSINYDVPAASGGLHPTASGPAHRPRGGRSGDAFTLMVAGGTRRHVHAIERVHRQEGGAHSSWRISITSTTTALV